MSDIWVFVPALIAVIFWGSQFVPIKKMKNPDMVFSSSMMGFGRFACSLAIILAMGYHFSLAPFGVLAGAVWAVGNLIQVLALERIGLSKGVSIPLGFNILLLFLWGTVFFQETISQIYLAVAGVATLLIGIPLLSVTREKKRTDLSGIALAAAAGFCFSLVPTIFKFSAIGTEAFLFPMSVGILVSSAAILLARRKFVREQVVAGLAAGGLWSVANVAALFSVTFLGVAIGFSLTQLALLVATLWGVFYFKEMKDGSKIRNVLVGAVLLILGALLLAFAK